MKHSIYFRHLQDRYKSFNPTVDCGNGRYNILHHQYLVCVVSRKLSCWKHPKFCARCQLSSSMPIPKWCAWFRTIPPLHDLAKNYGSRRDTQETFSTPIGSLVSRQMLQPPKNNWKRKNPCASLKYRIGKCKYCKTFTYTITFINASHYLWWGYLTWCRYIAVPLFNIWVRMRWGPQGVVTENTDDYIILIIYSPL